MIHYVRGNLLEGEAEALVNMVNIVGELGKGASDGIVERMKTEFGRNVRCYGCYMCSP